MSTFKPFYMHDFGSAADIISQFQIPQDTFDGAKVLLAYYNGGGYDGFAFVLYAFAGKLYEANGSHCSCYGLEGQWEPEETTIEALEHRLTEGTLGDDGYNHDGGYSAEVRAVIDYLKGGKGMLPPKYYGRPVTVPSSYRYSLSFQPIKLSQKRKDYRFFAGEQWSAAEIASRKEQPPFRFNTTKVRMPNE